MIIKEKNVDVNTGEEIVTEREETAGEIKAREKRQAEYAAAEKEAQTKATAKSALLEKLGITAEEAALLLS